MLFTVYSFHWGFPAPDIFTATSELPVNCDQADKLCLKYPSNLVGRWNRNASVAKCRAMSKTKKIILSHSVDPSSRYGHTIYLQACKLVYVQHYLAVKSDKCWQCLGRDETLSHPISSSSSLQAWLCQISIPNYPFRKNQISLDTAWEKLEITQCISLAGWLLCDISLQISQNLVPTLSAGANYLIYLQHHLPDFPPTPFSAFLENKSSLHHLSEVLPQYLRVSCSLKPWLCLQFSPSATRNYKMLFLKDLWRWEKETG